MIKYKIPSIGTKLKDSNGLIWEVIKIKRKKVTLYQGWQEQSDFRRVVDRHTYRTVKIHNLWRVYEEIEG